jgi:trehalose-phosphatase
MLDHPTFRSWLDRAASGCVLALDYDGTLTPIRERPELAAPDDELLALVLDLVRAPQLNVIVVSGRDLPVLHRWLAVPGVALVGGHGSLWMPPNGDPERLLAPDEARSVVSRAGRAAARALEVIAGAEVEEKAYSVAAHYRRVPAGRRKDWFDRWHQVVDRFSDRLQLRSGKCVEELCWPGIGKGAALVEVLDRLGWQGLPVLAIGDDLTDESMFEVLGPDDLTVHVGDGRTEAKLRAPDVSAVRELLRNVARRVQKEGAVS